MFCIVRIGDRVVVGGYGLKFEYNTVLVQWLVVYFSWGGREEKEKRVKIGSK